MSVCLACGVRSEDARAFDFTPCYSKLCFLFNGDSLCGVLNCLKLVGRRALFLNLGLLSIKLTKICSGCARSELRRLRFLCARLLSLPRDSGILQASG